MHSMTGFGRGSRASEVVAVMVEASSVNRKQGEVVFYMPRALAELEPLLRKRVLKRISRGRVNINIQLSHPEGVAGGVRIDRARAKALDSAFKELAELLGRPFHPEAGDFLRAPDILLFEDEHAPAAVLEVLEPALDEALDALIAMRADEGGDLAAECRRLLESLASGIDAIARRAPEVVTSYRENLLRRLREVGLDLDLDDERILREIALFADRCEITEEITRLRSHLRRFAAYLEATEPVGRAMDFLCQEMNREFNTIGAKANDAALAQHVVNAKTELEKAREQIQNVE